MAKIFKEMLALQQEIDALRREGDGLEGDEKEIARREQIITITIYH